MDSEDQNENHFHGEEEQEETNEEQNNNYVDGEQEQQQENEGDEEHIEEANNEEHPEEENNEEENENQKQEQEDEHDNDSSSPAVHDPEIESSIVPSTHFDDKDPLNQTASPAAAIPRPPSIDPQQNQKNSRKNSSATTAENNDHKFGQDVLSFDSNHTSKEQMEKQKSLFPPPSSSFPCHIFDPPPSSMHLLKLRPLGLFHKEPQTMKELIEPIPPDRSTFKGGLFNRKIHASNRKRTYDKQNTTTIADRVSPTRNVVNNTRESSAAAVHGSNISHSSFPQQQQQQQQPPPPPSQQLMTDFITISKIAIVNPSSSNAGSRSPRRRLSTASSTVAANDKSYLDMRQHITPTKLLPYRGQLPDASELYLADLRAAAKESAQATEEVVVHGREVVARKANTSPVGIYTEMLRKTSPVTGKLAIHHQQMMAKMQQQQKLFKEQQQQQTASLLVVAATTAATASPRGGRRNKNASSKDATPSSTNLLVAPDECEQSLMENSFLKSMIMLDPELAPGLVALRATLPPWAKAQQAEMSREELELLQMKNRKMLGGGGGKKSSGSPRFAAPTASRIKQLPVLQQAQINRQLGHDKPQDELEKQHMLFPSQLRPEDRAEIERREKALKDQSRRHYLDHMVLARLAPAEREARLADREKLAPYRKVTDRDLPFPEQAARDRLKHAKAKVPALVLEGQLAVETMVAYWKPKTTSPTIQLNGGGGGNTGAASFSASILNNNNSGNLNSSLNNINSPLLISSLGLSSTSIPQTARVGAGGDLPSEGAPKPKQPLTGRDKQIEKASERVQEQEKDLAQKYATLEAKLQAKQSRSQKKVFS